MRIWFWSPGPMQNQLWPHTSVASALGAWKWEDPGGSQVNQSKQLAVSGPSKGHWLKHKVEKNRSWYLTSTSELHTYTHGVTRMCTHIHAYTIHTQKMGKQRNPWLLWGNKMTTITATNCRQRQLPWGVTCCGSWLQSTVSSFLGASSKAEALKWKGVVEKTCL